MRARPVSPMATSPSPLLPVIDISPLLQLDAAPTAISAVDECMGRACTDIGFFYVVGHGIPADLQSELHAASAKFFSLDIKLKQKVAMALGGKAWRGKFTHDTNGPFIQHVYRTLMQFVPSLTAAPQDGFRWEMN